VWHVQELQAWAAADEARAFRGYCISTQQIFAVPYVEILQVWQLPTSRKQMLPETCRQLAACNP
jgi:hypothetical protein